MSTLSNFTIGKPHILNYRVPFINKKNKWWSDDPTWIRTSDSLGARTQDPILKRDVLYLLS